MLVNSNTVFFNTKILVPIILGIQDTFVFRAQLRSCNGYYFLHIKKQDV